MDALEYNKRRVSYKLLRGIANIVHTDTDIEYLIFYDLDREYTASEFEEIDALFKAVKISYMIYSTKHGYHIVGLTPVDAYTWGYTFSLLKKLLKEKYAGKVIRLDRKEGEIRMLKHLEISYGYVIPNLYNLIINRCENTKDLIRMPCTPPYKHRIQIEKYRSFKQ